MNRGTKGAPAKAQRSGFRGERRKERSTAFGFSRKRSGGVSFDEEHPHA